MGKLTHWAVVFSIIAAAAGLLAFAGFAGAAVPLAKVLFWISLAVVAVSLVGHAARGT
jgi:uncharacterized membrane protein YtjA (UPF0391 family)